MLLGINVIKIYRKFLYPLSYANTNIMIGHHRRAIMNSLLVLFMRVFVGFYLFSLAFFILLKFINKISNTKYTNILFFPFYIFTENGRKKIKEELKQ